MPHRTAITRRKLSRPAQYLLDSNLLAGRMLDYGCGRGGDAKRLECESYDPHYQPVLPEGKFDTILCTFVFNVCSYETRQMIIDDLLLKLEAGGMAYIAVRRDMVTGYTVSKGWSQYYVTLDLPTVYECGGYTIYLLQK